MPWKRLPVRCNLFLSLNRALFDAAVVPNTSTYNRVLMIKVLKVFSRNLSNEHKLLSTQTEAKVFLRWVRDNLVRYLFESPF